MANKVQTPSLSGTLIIDGEMPTFLANNGMIEPDCFDTLTVDSISITSTPCVYPHNQISGASGEKFVVNARLAYLPEFIGAGASPHLYPTSQTFKAAQGIHSQTFTFAFTPLNPEVYFRDHDDVVYGPPPGSGYGFSPDTVTVVAVGQNQITVSWNVFTPQGRYISFNVYNPGT